MRIEGQGCGQHGEDRILNMFFRDQPTGMVVDVGAANGWDNSNSYQLLQRPGWKGVMIDPLPSHFEALIKLYGSWENVQCVQCAVGTQEGIRPFWCCDQVSTLVRDNKKAAEDAHGVQFIKTTITVRTLTHILDEIDKDAPIDFLSIDAEGMNYDVWVSLDKARYAPRLVCIEGTGYAMEGYHHLCRLGGNSFYLRDDECSRL